MDMSELVGLATKVSDKRKQKRREEQQQREAERKEKIKAQAYSVCEDILKLWTERDDYVTIQESAGKIVLESESDKTITTEVDSQDEIIEEIANFFNGIKGYSVGYGVGVIIMIE